MPNGAKGGFGGWVAGVGGKVWKVVTKKQILFLG